jgi:leucyl aminopeptidase
MQNTGIVTYILPTQHLAEQLLTLLKSEHLDIDQMLTYAASYIEHENDRAAGCIFEESIADKLITGAASETVSFREANLNNFRHVIIVGLGADAKITHETISQAAAAFYKEVKALKTLEAFVQLDGLTASKKDFAQYTQAFVEGLHLAAYNFDELKSKELYISWNKDEIRDLILLLRPNSKDDEIESIATQFSSNPYFFTMVSIFFIIDLYRIFSFVEKVKSSTYLV